MELQPKIKLVISDFHIGTGHRKGVPNYYEEFRNDKNFVDFLEYYSGGDYSDHEVELIINGDFLDLIKVKVDGEWHEQVTERIAVVKVRQCLEGHPDIVAAFKRFISSPKRKITYIPGNHDIDMMWKAAAQAFEETVSEPESRERVKVYRESDTYLLPEGIQIHHGHQFELNNSFDYRRLFVTHTLTGPVAEPYIQLPWGSVFILKVINPLKPERPYIDQVAPFRNLLVGGLLFDTAFTIKLIVHGAYYWLHTRLALLFRSGLPVRSAWRTMWTSVSFFPNLERYAKRILKSVYGIHTVIMGHDHFERCRVYEDGKMYINTGTWINMVSMDMSKLGTKQRLSYALIEYPQEGKPQATLMLWHGWHTPCERLSF